MNTDNETLVVLIASFDNQLTMCAVQQFGGHVCLFSFEKPSFFVSALRAVNHSILIEYPQELTRIV